MILTASLRQNNGFYCFSSRAIVQFVKQSVSLVSFPDFESATLHHFGMANLAKFLLGTRPQSSSVCSRKQKHPSRCLRRHNFHSHTKVIIATGMDCYCQKLIGRQDFDHWVLTTSYPKYVVLLLNNSVFT